uniref:Uncharacterized protein n=1 Tax=Oryza nivara TaxID=4536 RepID=A0A0E0G5L7_ORYNI
MELYPMVEKPVELLGAQLFHRCISMMSRTDVDFQRLRQRLDRMQVIMASSAGSKLCRALNSNKLRFSVSKLGGGEKVRGQGGFRGMTVGIDGAVRLEESIGQG